MRQHKVVTIVTEGRDKGKSFLLVEKSAYDAEKWATRALMALSRSGVDVPEEVLQAGAIGLLMVGVEGFKRMQFADAEPLLDEMMDCVSFVPDPSKFDPATQRPFSRPLTHDPDSGDIQDVATLLRLRGECLELHLGFSLAAVLSDLKAAVASSSRQNTSMSPAPAAPSSRRKKQA